MNLIGQERDEKGEKVKKFLKISIIITVIIFFIVLALMIYLSYQDSKILKMYIDTKKVAISDNLFSYDSESIYISIQDIAQLVGYTYYNGEYNKYTEEQNKGYVSNKQEIAGFEAGLNTLYKGVATDNVQNYDWYTLDAPVKIIQGKLYMTSKSFEKAFNSTFKYDQEKNRIEIYTLPYLVATYEESVISNYKYAGLEKTNYNNQKAILDNMLVVKQAESEKDKFKYGVVSLNNSPIIGVKYDDIEYIEVASDFYVTVNAKKGIVSNTGAQKIEPNYDVIKVLDNDLRLYYVENSNMCGVLDRNGKKVVYMEYNKIGVASSLFPNDDIKNNMLLYENCIPVMRNNRWGIIDKNGNILIEPIFDSLGYVSGTKKTNSENNLLLIPSIEGIVVCQNGKYGIINSTGRYISTCQFDKIYSVTNLEQNKYYIEYNGDKFTIEEFMSYRNTALAQ